MDPQVEANHHLTANHVNYSALYRRQHRQTN